MGRVNRRVTVHMGLGINWRSYLKNRTYVIEPLPDNHEALSSNPSTTKKQIHVQVVVWWFRI
jgi:hypothetical protein